jgi:hypothetical protein
MTLTENTATILTATLLGCLSILFIFLLHPRLGIRDVDGYSYIMGARSLHLGSGYRGLTGEFFNHWPPGYSLLLSPFPDPVLAAMILSYLFYGVTVGPIYYLLRCCEWSWQAAIGFTLVLASGFFRLLANWVHPDIMAYALFLVGVCLAVQGSRRSWPGIIWALLIQMKFIAAVFLPAAVMADALTIRQDWRKLVRSYIPAALVAALSLGSILHSTPGPRTRSRPHKASRPSALLRWLQKSSSLKSRAPSHLAGTAPYSLHFPESPSQSVCWPQ